MHAASSRDAAVLATPVAPAAGRALGNIQLLRGAAAGSVLLHHAFVYAEALRGVPRPLPAFDALLGLMGVAVFFAISGFLMAGLVARTDPWTFLAHRLARIFPTFLGVVALAALAFAALRIGFGLNPVALTLAPAGPRTYPLNVEWTLVFETSFYVGLFGLAWAGFAARLAPVAGAWLGLLALAWWALPPSMRALTLPPPHLLPLSAACVPFAGGLLLPRLVASGRMRPGLAVLAIPLVAACGQVDLESARWLGGVAAVLLVGAAIQVRQVGRDNPLGRATIAFGDWSYVLYLAHVPTILLVARYAPAGWPGPAIWLAAIAVPIVVAGLLGPVDVALYRRLRRRVDRAAPRALRLLGGAYLCIFAGVAIYGSLDSLREERLLSWARSALAALPADALASPETAAAGISRLGNAPAAGLRAAVDGIERVSPGERIVGAWAFDPERPDEIRFLAAACGGRIVALDRARRLRPDLAGRAGLAGRAELASAGRRRIGYRLRLPDDGCRADAIPVLILVDSRGAMALLPADGRPIGPSGTRP